MRHRIGLGIGIIAILAMFVTDSNATTIYYFGGNTCHPTLGTNLTKVNHDAEGANNTSTSAFNVNCPTYGWTTPPYEGEHAQVWAKDVSTTSTLNCFPEVEVTSGSIYQGTVLYLCTTGGGCTSSPGNSYTTSGWGNYLSWDFSQMPNAGNSISNVMTVQVTCQIAGSSWIYRILHETIDP